MRPAAFGHDRREIGLGQDRRMFEDRFGDLDDVARKTLNDHPRGLRIGGQALCQRGARRHIGRTDESQRVLGVM